ncbi:MAG: SpoIIE family protein phosphatase [Ignavibacteria bacterium]
MFVFYSDGLTEAMNRNREEFGTDKVMDIISLNRQNSCSLIQKEIINSVDHFRGSAEQNDDITLVVTKIKTAKDKKQHFELELTSNKILTYFFPFKKLFSFTQIQIKICSLYNNISKNQKSKIKKSKIKMIPRYSRKEISDIWSDESKFRIWLI